jgi:hypothetical protein
MKNINRINSYNWNIYICKKYVNKYVTRSEISIKLLAFDVCCLMIVQYCTVNMIDNRIRSQHTVF